LTRRDAAPGSRLCLWLDVDKTAPKI